MGSAHAHTGDSTRAAVGSLVKLAPSGRVIRGAGKGILTPPSAPANRDLPVRAQDSSVKRRFVAIACCGLLSGVVLSLLAPSVDLLASSDYSQKLFSVVKEDFARRESDLQVPEAPAPGAPAPKIEQQRSQPKRSRDDRELDKILAAANVMQHKQSVRLATYHVEPAVEVAEPPVQRAYAIEASHQDRTPSTPSRSVLVRVHSIIKKYSPKHKSAVQLAHAIVQESSRQGVDPLFVAAVIKSESAFNASARSHKGAQGLMQIMPATGAWLVARHDLPRGRLTDPGFNLRLGISYLKYLEQTYSGNRVFALVAYNWGPGHVDSAAGGRRRIPKECMQYALKIMHDYRRWSSGVI
jgi:soluble lytic murein transglycosylase-like protein